MDGFGGSDASTDKANLAREYRAVTQFQRSHRRGRGSDCGEISGPNHVDARTLVTIPKLGEVNGREPTSLVSWSDKKHIVVASRPIRINFKSAIHGD